MVRSKTLQRILDSIPQEVVDRVDKYADELIRKRKYQRCMMNLPSKNPRLTKKLHKCFWKNPKSFYYENVSRWV